MFAKLNRELKEFGLLLKAVPPVTVAIFVISIVIMNLLANKQVGLPEDMNNYIVLDCGIIVSWCAFLAMDVFTKHYGPKAATEISIFALLINFIVGFVFYIGSVIPGFWGESFAATDGAAINDALDKTFGGTWYVVLGSSAAFATSAFANNFINFGIGKLFKKNPDGAMAYYLRAYISTSIAQFIDNLLFAFIVSYNFFDISALACVTCAATGMVAELLCEAAFSPIGYALCKKWKRENAGEKYFEFCKDKLTAEECA